MNSVSERSRVRPARSLSGAAEGRRDDASDLCIAAELNSVSYLQLDLPPWQRRVSVASGPIAGVAVNEQRPSMVDANPRVPRGNTRVFKLNLPLIFIGCRKLQRTRADWSRDGQNAA